MGFALDSPHGSFCLKEDIHVSPPFALLSFFLFLLPFLFLLSTYVPTEKSAATALPVFVNEVLLEQCSFVDILHIVNPLMHHSIVYILSMTALMFQCQGSVALTESLAHMV